MKKNLVLLVLFVVVIPIQTISFYNKEDRTTFAWNEVVIPIQTISFYNRQQCFQL